MIQNNTSKLKFTIEAKHTTHSGGKGEYLHDWYAYLEGFSSSFVKGILDSYAPDAKIVLEPFAGVGTTPINCSLLGVKSYYCEINPALIKVIDAKEHVISLNKRKKDKLIKDLLDLSENLELSIEKHVPCESLRKRYYKCFGKSEFFNKEAFEKVLKTRSFIDSLNKENEYLSTSIEVAVMSCIISCSLLKRSGDVRFKNEKELLKGIPEFYSSVSLQLKKMAIDCEECPSSYAQSHLLAGNAKDLLELESVNADIVITSPPYLNGTNYFRNTKLELWFIGELHDEKSLRGFRDQVVTAGINDVTRNKGNEILPIINDLYDELLEKSYDKRISKMMAAYFQEMKIVLEGLKHQVKDDGFICIDIGDSIYSKIYIPTHQILTDIAKDIGLEFYDEITLRKRTSKDGSSLGQFLIVFKNSKEKI